MASAWVGLPQVSQVVASGNVALWLAEFGVVGTGFGVGAPSREGSQLESCPVAAKSSVVRQARPQSDRSRLRGILHRPSARQAPETGYLEPQALTWIPDKSNQTTAPADT
jgi:hypothetical protein